MKNYPNHYQELARLMKDMGKEIPQQMQGFSALHKASLTDNVLSKRTKELIALAIAISVRCDGCIAFHVHDALKAGCTQDEVMETIGVAILMGGGPAVVYGCEAMAALNQFVATDEFAK